MKFIARPTASAACLAALALAGLSAHSLPASAEPSLLSPDARASSATRAVVQTSANGTPVVQIRRPSAAGVSRNVFSRFDVDSRGVVLNNSTTGGDTQTAGYLAANSALDGDAARIILSEVNSSDPSRLRGAIEVAGKGAQVIVANPAGITCDGCSFINVKRATLTTGTPLWSEGDISGYRVTGGTVRIGAKGMDTHFADYTDVIARAVEVNGELQAHKLEMILGTNRVTVGPRSTQVVAESPQGAQGNGAAYGRTGYAVDVGNLGAMYANSIRLVGTEAGMGVRSYGYITADSGNLSIDTAGVLANPGIIRAGGDITLKASSIEHNGAMSATGNVSLRGRTVLMDGSVWAGQFDDLSMRDTPTRLEVTAEGRLQARGVYNASGDIILQGQDVNLRGGSFSANQAVDVRATRALVHDLAQTTANSVRFAAPDISNQWGVVDQLGDGTASLVATRLYNGQGAYVRSEGDLVIGGGKAINLYAATTDAAGSIQWLGVTNGTTPATVPRPDDAR